MHLSSDSKAWLSPSPIRRQSSGYHSTSPPITQAARETQTHPLSNLRTPICLPQPDFFLFPSSRSGDGKLSYPSHANFQISQSTTLNHPPLFVSIHAMPAIPLLGFYFLRGKNFIDSSLSVCAGAGLAKIGIRHSGKTIKGLRQRETGKEKAGEKEKEFAIKKSR